ncbi:MAG: hypothetical protein GOP50_04225 [Candidatus Heimdallarchaeota archaeon]|nr:hypothetical protein [Candidatus Heimdallarchaeota archaeon]
MKRKIRFIIITICCFLIVIAMSMPITSQTQQTALLAIQQADDKLLEVVSSLEEASRSNIDIRDLVITTEDARQLIAIAKEMYNEASYTAAYSNAINANEELDSVVDEVELRTDNNQQNRTILFSLLGVFSAIFTGLVIFLIIRKGYPWYLEKRNEEFGKLEIQYIEKTEGVKDE